MLKSFLSLCICLILVQLLHAKSDDDQRTSIAYTNGKLYLNGKENGKSSNYLYRMKGVNYSPIPIGYDPSTESDFTQPSYSHIYNRDINFIRYLGANTVRLYTMNNSVDHTDFLDECYNSGKNPIYVLLSYYIPPGLPIEKPEERKRLVTEFSQMVKTYKDHPAVLMYLIGNQLNDPSMYGEKLDALFTLADEIVNATKAIENDGNGYHFVLMPMMEYKLFDTIRRYSKSKLDAWAVQLYRGKTFGTFFAEYKNTTSSKPLLITEFGIDSYDDKNMQEDEEQQNAFIGNLAQEIMNNYDLVSGGAVFEYSDEWWKSRLGINDARHPNCPSWDTETHQICGFPNPAFPDGYSNEAWYGIFKVFRTSKGRGYDRVYPRPVAFTLASLWGGDVKALFYAAPAPSVHNVWTIAFSVISTLVFTAFMML